MSTFWRLLGFLRPYRKGVILSFGLAFGALVGTVLIPYLTGLAINAIRDHDHHELIVLAHTSTAHVSPATVQGFRGPMVPPVICGNIVAVTLGAASEEDG